MNTLKSLVLLTLVGASFVACKKGENDPFLSLKSRDARISGEWELDSYSSKDISILTYNLKTDTIHYESFDYNGNNEVYYYLDTMVAYDTSIQVDYTLTIEKGGLYSLNTDYIYGETTTSGNWFWTNNGKNKTGITFDDDSNAFEILELRKDKMVLTRNSSNEVKVDSLNSTLVQNYTEKRTYLKVD